MGIFTRQVQKSSVSEISETTLPETKDWISEQWRNYFASKYNHVFTRQGRSKNHVVKTNFYSPLIPIQEKGRRIPVHILGKVEAEIEKLMAQNHIQKLDSCTDDFFIAPIVITAKKDGSIKLALDAKPVNAQIHKNKYQMPVVDELLSSIAQIISERKEGEEVWTKLDCC